jgi:hypothetical protein
VLDVSLGYTTRLHIKKKKKKGQEPWLMPVTSAIWEAAIKRITAQG